MMRFDGCIHFLDMVVKVLITMAIINLKKVRVRMHR